MSKRNWMLPVLLAFAASATAAGGPGLYELELYADDNGPVGTVGVWNTNELLVVKVLPTPGWRITDVQIYAGLGPIPTKNDKAKPGQFPFKIEPPDPVPLVLHAIDLKEELDFRWGDRDARTQTVAVHVDLVKYTGDVPALDEEGEPIQDDAWARGPIVISESPDQRCLEYTLSHPMRGQFIDAPVQGLTYHGPTQQGVTGKDELGEQGGFLFFPGEWISFSIGTVDLGDARAARKVTPLDLFPGSDVDDPRVIGVARVLQTLDYDSGAERSDGKIVLLPAVVDCWEDVVAARGVETLDYGYTELVDTLLDDAVTYCDGVSDLVDGELVTAELAAKAADEAQGNLEAGLNASGIFRKNLSKTPELGESKQKLDVMPVYFPGLRSNGEPSLCVDENGDGIYDEGTDTLGVAYEEWRLNGDPAAEECDPRNDGEACTITLIECREVAKPIVTAYREGVDIYDDQITTDFWPGRFSTDIFVSISRDDGTTWKRMNVSRMADLTSFDLETGEPFPGTSSSPYLKVNDNYILAVWESKFCRSGNPRYSITTCDDPDTEVVETPETGCQEICRGNVEKGTYVCEADYPFDDDYHVTDIWGVRGQQRSVDYDEVDDVADLGVGEIPYSCLWVARGVIVTQKNLDEGTFASLLPEDDPATEEDESDVLVVGDIVWFKPERLTSGRRDAYVPVVGSARGAGFAIAWQEDPSGLRPGKGKGPGQGWSGAISNHKSDIWYSFLSYDDFAFVDENFVPGGPGDDPNGQARYDEKPGLGRPKALVPFSLPARISDNDMVNSDTLKVEQSSTCVTPPYGTEPVCFPEVADGSFVALDEEEIATGFCDHPDADPATCCDPDNHQEDPNCEDLKGLYGNLTGTKRYAYLAKTIDEIDNATGLHVVGGDGIPDYQYYSDGGGTLDLCDTSGTNAHMETLPGTSAHERWYTFANAAEASKLVCVTSDGRLLDGDVSASRPNIQMQPYTKTLPDGTKTKSAWVLLAYEESKGMGHSLAAAEHEDNDNPVDEIIGDIDESGQVKPIKQDLGKNVIYHSFDFTKPDLVAPGHIVNLPALCGGLYPTYCDDPKTPDIVETNEQNPTCTCTAGEPIPLYFEDFIDNGDGTGEWIPNDTLLLQFRTEIARRARFIVQSPSKIGDTNTLGAIIYKQGQEGQGRPADVFIRRIVKSGSGNPYKFESFECTTHLDETFSLPACPNGAGDKPSAVGYNCNVWGEASGDRLCGGTFLDPFGGFERRDHVNLTSADVDLAVDAGPVDETPEDPTDDRYGTNKVLLWSQYDYNLGNESYGLVHDDGTACDVLGGEVCPAMYSNSRSHRGFIRGDVLIAAYASSPNWAAGRNGNDRYNFYVRRSFDGGQTWTTTPGGAGVYACPEWRSDPTNPDPEGSGNLPPEVIDPECDPCATFDELGACVPSDSALFYGAGEFEPARNISEIKNNKETSSDPRVGATPPTYPLDGRVGTLPVLRFVEDEYVDNVFFVAWGTGDNVKSTGGTTITPEAAPLDLYYTRTEDYGDTYLKVPWLVNGDNSNNAGETVMRYERLAWGDEEQGECQLRATSDGSKVYAIYHQLIPVEGDPDEPITRWYPWEVEDSHDNDLWFRRVIFWPTTQEPTP